MLNKKVYCNKIIAAIKPKTRTNECLSNFAIKTERLNIFLYKMR